MSSFTIRLLSLLGLAAAAAGADRLGPLPDATPPPVVAPASAPASAATPAAAAATPVTPPLSRPAAASPAGDARRTDELEPAVRTSSSASPRGGRAQDRVELENTQITGNRELPRVMYVVPWKKPELGDLGGRPAQSLLDELLEPVDRDVFQRQVRYYGALQPDAGGRQPPAVAAPAGEK